MVALKSNSEKVSFESLHHRFSSTDSKVRTASEVSITDSGNESVE